MTGDGSPAQGRDVGINAYIYLYPLVTMDTTRRQAISIEPGNRPGFGPMNTFSHIREFPAADIRTNPALLLGRRSPAGDRGHRPGRRRGDRAP